MHRDKSFRITEKQYNYLLPVFGIAAQGQTRLLAQGCNFYFIGTDEDYLDMLNRCLYL